MIDYLSILKLIFNNTNTVALVLSNFNTYILCLLIVLTNDGNISRHLLAKSNGYAR